MVNLTYTPDAIEKLRNAVLKRKSLEELASMIGISEKGVVQRIRLLARKEPEKWPQEIIKEYSAYCYQKHRKEDLVYNKAWRARRNNARNAKGWRRGEVVRHLIDLITLMLSQGDLSEKEMQDKLKKAFGFRVNCTAIEECIKDYSLEEWIKAANGKYSLTSSHDARAYLTFLQDRTRDSFYQGYTGTYTINRKLINRFLDFLNNDK